MKTRTNQPVLEIKVKDITKMGDTLLNQLKCGDRVAKVTGDMEHNYIVTYKEEKKGICLSYYAKGYLETISYDYTAGHWVYNSTDVFNADEKVDKDILDKIVVNSYEGTTLFPANVLPLRIRCADNETYYFDYENTYLLHADGSQYVEILLDDESVMFDSDFPDIVEIDYAYFNGIFRKLNSYYMYNPITSGGTKLYKHTLQFNSYDFQVYVISNKSSKYTTLQEIITDYTEGRIINMIVLNKTAIYFSNSIIVTINNTYDGFSSLNITSFDEDDTVTEL